ncbi:Protein NPG1 [Camellia lanceoleosa]|uniref:Protein NPG1 n=1 Tax=Camellia lanceoleosa TaxID=1840588 RepID=A0ACC0G4L0_9ERIC|nr:Protein NPG1 [Camellia lanceoleosa]
MVMGYMVTGSPTPINPPNMDEEELIVHGRSNYEKGNVEGALSAFDGIDLHAAIQELQPLAEKQPSKKGRPSNEFVHSSSQEAASLVLEALYLKAKSLQKLGRKGFAIFLLYSGVEVGPPSLAVQIDGSYVPRNNLEEAILLLMILMRKFYLGKTKWDPLVIEHLTFALSLCSQTSVLAKQLEEIMPGVFNRVNRWKAMALCYSGAGQNKVSLNLLRKSLHKHEKPDDLTSLLLATKICSEDALLAAEGVGYAQRAILHMQGLNEHLKGVGLCTLALCLGKLAKVSSSDHKRSRLQTDALKSLDKAIVLERNNFDLIFELGVQYAER